MVQIFPIFIFFSDELSNRQNFQYACLAHTITQLLVQWSFRCIFCVVRSNNGSGDKKNGYTCQQANDDDHDVCIKKRQIVYVSASALYKTFQIGPCVNASIYTYTSVVVVPVQLYMFSFLPF